MRHESDIDDAFAMIAGEIIGLAQEKKKGNKPAARRFAGTAFATGKVLLQSGLKVAVGLAERLGSALFSVNLSREELGSYVANAMIA